MRLTLIGAGPGDPELITLKGIHALRSADVVLYDALVNEALLEYAPPVAERVFVGKRRGSKSYEQEEINAMIVLLARQFGHVVRLKGGDPFVFGRGMEEMRHAQEHGIETAYIPGISSAIAAPGLAGIPVTLRGASRSFWTMTATTDTGELNPEIATAAATDATLVLLMGLSKIGEIAAIYAGLGKNDLPVAVIQDASLPTQTVVTGCVRDIESRAHQWHPIRPAVVVIGGVAGSEFAELKN
jgi:uroporphyrin-III C-methyltransferase